MPENSETRQPNGADGLIAGILDVMAGLAMAVCHTAKMEPAALAQAMIDATESTITPLTPADYAAGRRFAAARIAETLRGMGLPKKEGEPARTPFEVILGGQAGTPKPETPRGA